MKLLKTKLIAASCLSMFALASWAADVNKCPATKANTLDSNTTVFFYETTQNNKSVFIPMIKMADGKLVSARETQIPTTFTLYDLRNDKPVTVTFANVHDNVDYDLCRSIGSSKLDRATEATLYASKPLAKAFHFTVDKVDQDRFNASLSNACKPGQKKFDRDGITTCDSDKLIATSHLLEQTQYWRTKQYRYDLGFAVNIWDDKQQKLIEIAEDCAVCKD